MTDSRLASLGARAIRTAFGEYRSRIGHIAGLAKQRFEKRMWRTIQADSVAMIEIYKEVTRDVVSDIRSLLGHRVGEKQLWVGLKAVYSSLIDGLDAWELAETFFNSVTRQIFATVGVDPQIEFVDTDFETPPTQSDGSHFKVYSPKAPISALLVDILSDYPFDVEYEDKDRDVRLVVEQLEERLRPLGGPGCIHRLEVLKSVFYRGRAAYIVGRIVCRDGVVPLVIALDNTELGIIVDAVLLSEDLVSILFSFTHSYFRVLAERPYDIVQFIASTIPKKRIAELYISLGFNNHGKTELYRDFRRHLVSSDEQFDFAAGIPGLVMVVFTMPGYDMVFKVIRDRFAKPKNVTRRHVMGRYRLVFRHDRAGRLLDAQEFEHLKFHRRQFRDRLLEELLAEASETVALDGDYVIIHHSYVERRLSPLNVYLAEHDEKALRDVVIDYGQAIKDLMKTNIFPGDLLLKNFGVTRHGRVVFYDYDEICFLTECHFRKMPEPRTPEEELAAEPWFSVGPNDVFPEEFEAFLGFSPELRQLFKEQHGDLLEAGIWQATQARLRRGDLIRIYPYRQSVRLRQTRPSDRG